MGEIYHEGFGKSGVDEVENSDGYGKGWGDIQRHDWQQLA